MNRNEYLDRLASLLREFDREYQQEIFEAVNAHFEEGLREGRTEEEIASDLGDPAAFASGREAVEPVESAEEPHFRFEEEPREEPISVMVNRLVRGILGKVKQEVGQASWSFHVDNTPLQHVEDGGSVRRIEISGGALDVNIEPSEDGLLSYAYPANASPALNLQRRGDTLVFSSAETLRTLQERLRLALPESVDEIAIELSSGDVRIETLALSVLSLHSTSGDVDLDTVAVEELTHRSTSGDLQGDNIRIGTLRSDTTSGDVKLDGSVLRCAIHTVSGDMDLSGDFPTCELSSVSGDVELEGTPVYWRVKTVSGEVDLSLPNGDTTLYFHSRSGEAGGVWRSGVRMVEDPEEAAIVVETVSGDLSL